MESVNSEIILIDDDSLESAEQRPDIVSRKVPKRNSNELREQKIIDVDALDEAKVVCILDDDELELQEAASPKRCKTEMSPGIIITISGDENKSHDRVVESELPGQSDANKPDGPSLHSDVGPKPSPDIILDPKQQQILDLCMQGRNVFFTGMGGTGKTFLLLQIAARLKTKLGSDKVAVTAPTGVAAIICQGQTLHSLAGCGVPTYVADFDKCWKQKNRWRKLSTLIVDEVSMLEPSYLDWLDATVRSIRGVPHKAFGGIQLIFCGDFGQLPGICKGATLGVPCPIRDRPSTARIPVVDERRIIFNKVFPTTPSKQRRRVLQ